MSLLTWLFKSKKAMAKQSTRPVKLGKYKITAHAQNRVADPRRNVTKFDMVNNLFSKPNVITEIKFDKQNRPSYNRIGKKVTTYINPEKKTVTSIRVVSQAEIKKYQLEQRNNKYYRSRRTWNKK